MFAYERGDPVVGTTRGNRIYIQYCITSALKYSFTLLGVW